MQKDVIYIDTEDDITSIIGKVKNSDGKVVALVPPKRIGAIQSAVNLKLVNRAAETAKKRLVIVTNNHALSALAGSAGIPVAKNLESRPEMPELTAIEVDDDDIIDGSALPVGDHVKLSQSPEKKTDDDDAESYGITPEALGGAAVAGASHADAEPDKDKPAKSRTKVPDFNSFRKKLFLGIAAAIALVVFLVWAVVYAPSGTITISANTSDITLNSKVALGAKLVTSLQNGTLAAEVKTSTKDVSVAVTATGKKDVGDKAAGEVKITPTQQTIVSLALSAGSTTVEAGTTITASGGNTYVTDKSITFTSQNLPTTGGGVTVGVTATAPGTAYNGASGSASVSGGGFTAQFTTSPTGGTDKTVTVVQQTDVDAVSGTVVKTEESDAAKKALQDQYSKDYIAVADSFKVDSSAVKPSPAVNEEATDGKASLTGKITYSMVFVSKQEVGKYLDAYFAQQIDGRANQKIYGNGLSSAAFSGSVVDGERYIVTISAKGSVGPKIDENDVKQYAKGKKSGEIKAYVEAVNGVESANVSFSPFWVSTAPNDISKIKVEFKLNG